MLGRGGPKCDMLHLRQYCESLLMLNIRFVPPLLFFNGAFFCTLNHLRILLNNSLNVTLGLKWTGQMRLKNLIWEVDSGGLRLWDI